LRPRDGGGGQQAHSKSGNEFTTADYCHRRSSFCCLFDMQQTCREPVLQAISRAATSRLLVTPLQNSVDSVKIGQNAALGSHPPKSGSPTRLPTRKPAVGHRPSCTGQSGDRATL
jgi:hypothetical protein